MNVFGLDVSYGKDFTTFGFPDPVDEPARRGYERMLALAFGIADDVRYEWVDPRSCRVTKEPPQILMSDRIIAMMTGTPIPYAFGVLEGALEDAASMGMPERCRERLRREYLAMVDVDPRLRLPAAGKA